MSNSNRTEFKDYCLRNLGAPVIRINVADVQVEDRIDEALDLFYEEHVDAVEPSFILHTVTQTDIDNNSVPTNADVLAIADVVIDKDSSSNFASVGYQMRKGMMEDWIVTRHTNISDYVLMEGYYNLIRDTLGPRGSQFVHVPHANLITFNSDLASYLSVGDTVAIAAISKLDPNTNIDVWNDRWLKAYASALIKRQWGTNMKKHSGIELPGGVTLNGKEIYDEAMDEIRQLEEEVALRYGEPLGIIIG